ncbi:MAG: 4Fe-4S binding protein [Chromatiales bacterium]|nr:4Fe-4S binding protein [Chromatiales bacterium]
MECPFGAIDEDEKRFPVFNESRCRRCGTCMGACPVRVISFENYSVDTVGMQIKAVDMPGRVLREAAHPDAGLRERRLPGARHGRHAAQRCTRPSCASSRCAAWARSTPSGSPTRSTAATTA